LTNVVAGSWKDRTSTWQLKDPEREYLGTSRNNGRTGLGLNVLDARRRVDLELATTLAKKELDGSKVALVEFEATTEFGSTMN
jgi:hypothetical protein